MTDNCDLRSAKRIVFKVSAPITREEKQVERRENKLTYTYIYDRYIYIHIHTKRDTHVRAFLFKFFALRRESKREKKSERESVKV